MVLPPPRSHAAEAGGLAFSPPIWAEHTVAKARAKRVRMTTCFFMVSPFAKLQCQEFLTFEKGFCQRSYYAPRAVAVTIVRMPVFDDKQDELEHYETMMGVPRGRLAVTMDMITDAMALVGQHGVYCQSQRWPGKPVMDVQLIMKNLTDAKELIQSVMEELRPKA